MKTNLIKRLAVVTLALAMCSTMMLGGTLARYTGTVTGSGTANIAAFDYDVTANGDSIVGKTTLDLFSQTVASGETNVKEATNLIAPGTKGTFTIKTVNNSDVTVDDTFVITETQNNMPGINFANIVYKFDGNYYSNNFSAGSINVKITANGPLEQVTITGDLAALSTAISAKNSALKYANPNETEIEYVVDWYWGFNDEDAANDRDSALGAAAAGTGTQPSVTLTIEATIAQID